MIDGTIVVWLPQLLGHVRGVNLAERLTGLNAAQ
jgi:hypothetical protein